MHGSWSKERRSICAPAHSPRVVYFDLCSVNASFRKFLQQKSREQPGDRLRKGARSGGHAPAALGLTSDVRLEVGVIFYGDSDKTILHPWRAHLYAALETTTMPTPYMCAQSGVNYLYSKKRRGVGSPIYRPAVLPAAQAIPQAEGTRGEGAAERRNIL